MITASSVLHSIYSQDRYLVINLTRLKGDNTTAKKERAQRNLFTTSTPASYLQVPCHSIETLLVQKRRGGRPDRDVGKGNCTVRSWSYRSSCARQTCAQYREWRLASISASRFLLVLLPQMSSVRILRKQRTI